MAGGRSPKSDEARRPVTVTLPERTLQQLAAIDPDRARAIVKLADMATGGGNGPMKPVEVVKIAPDRAIILVGPSRALKRIRGLRLVEVAPARFLLTVPSGTPVESFEISLMDLIESFRGRLPARMVSIPVVDPHPSEIVHRIVAETPFSFLLKRGYIAPAYELRIRHSADLWRSRREQAAGRMRCLRTSPNPGAEDEAAPVDR